MTKTCSKCKRELQEFYFATRANERLDWWCRECKSAYYFQKVKPRRHKVGHKRHYSVDYYPYESLG